MIIVNTPHNPTGAVWGREDWLNLIELIRDKNIIVLSDEVYEHLIFDGRQHLSALSFPELRERSFCRGLIWENLSCHRLENRLLHCSASLDASVSPNLSICQFLRCYARTNGIG